MYTIVLLLCTILASTHAQIDYVTVQGHRFATLDNANPTRPPTPNTPCQEALIPRFLPAGWAVAEDNDYARLAAKLYPFAADGVVFASGLGFATVVSARIGRSSTWDELTMHGLENEGNRVSAVQVGSLCLRVMITQPAMEHEVDTVKKVQSYEKGTTTLGTQMYASLDGTPTSSPCCVPGDDAQKGPYEVPMGWRLAGPTEVHTLNLGAMGSVCMVGSDGLAYQCVAKDPCYATAPDTVVLMGHVGQNWSVWWPSADHGSLRIVITRNVSVSTTLLTSDMSTLLLTTYDAVSDPGWAINDTALVYAREALKEAGVHVRELGVLDKARNITHDADYLALYTADESPLYHSVVLTSSQLGVQTQSGDWVSALPPAHWAKLKTYCALHKIRTWSIFSYPGPDIGFQSQSAPVSSMGEGLLWAVSPARQPETLLGPMTLSQNSVFRYGINRNAIVKAGIAPAVYFTENQHLTIENITHPSPSMEVGGIYLSKTITRGEELHFFFASSYEVPHGQPMATFATDWLLSNVAGHGNRKSESWWTNAHIGMVLGGTVGSAACIILGYGLVQRVRKDRPSTEKDQPSESSEFWNIHDDSVKP